MVDTILDMIRSDERVADSFKSGLPKLKRLTSCSTTDYRAIRARQRRGTLSEYYDEQGYVCYDENELKDWKPAKRGRKPIKQ